MLQLLVVLKKEEAWRRVGQTAQAKLLRPKDMATRGGPSVKHPFSAVSRRLCPVKARPGFRGFG